MDETTEKEKMRALQKAYAETILNTAKEAAVRIMSSERKAHQYHRDLSFTKDEALRLLLRLKHTFHTQINEAEMISLNQQRRIDELEAQLQEAEDVVSNLRAELNDAHMKLEEMANNKNNHQVIMSEKVCIDDGTKQPNNGLPEADLAAKINLINNFDNGNHAADNSLEKNGHSVDLVVPSMIMRSKEPELYRNGCTQRIRAYEGNLVNGHLSLSGELDDRRDEKAIREDEEREDKQDLVMKNSSSVCPVLERKKRKIKSRARYVTYKPIQYLPKEKPSDLPGSQTCLCLCTSHDDMHEGSDNKDKGTHVHSPSTVTPNFTSSVYPVVERKKRKIKSRLRYVTYKPIQYLAKEKPSDLPGSQPCLCTSRDDMHEGCHNKNKGTHVHSPSTVTPNVSEMDVLAGHLVSSQGDEAETCMAVNEDTKKTSTLVSDRKPSDSEDFLDDANLKQDLEIKDSSSENPDSKQLEAGDGFASAPAKDRFLKYTFQRKRKKVSLSGDDKILQQENPLKRRIVKKQHDNLEAPESTTVAESSRDSRRMAQVARQLISLSEKKGWK